MYNFNSKIPIFLLIIFSSISMVRKSLNTLNLKSIIKKKKKKKKKQSINNIIIINISNNK